MSALEWVNTAGTLALAGAAFWGLRQANRETVAARQLAHDDIEARTAAERRQFELARVLVIAHAFERYLESGQNEIDGVAGGDNAATIRANLAALPLRYLPMFRRAFDVKPDARDLRLYASRMSSASSIRDRPQTFRDDLMTLLFRLSGAGTDQDYEPIGSPTADRPRTGPGANQP